MWMMTNLSDFDRDPMFKGVLGYCCKDPSCKILVHTYKQCKVCGRPCPSCPHDLPFKRRSF